MLKSLTFLDSWNPNETFDLSKLPLQIPETVNSTRKNPSDTNSYDTIYVRLDNNTTFDLRNLTKNLWPSLHPYNWQEQAEKILQQPEYVVMLILCVFALIANIISIIATCHVKHSLTTHLKLIINLGVSDILIVFSILILIMNKIFNTPLPNGITEPSERLLNACFFATVNSTYIMSFLIALSNLLAMALDHYIAIMIPLQYPRILSKRRGYFLIGSLWFLAALGGFSNFIIGAIGYKPQKLFNFCEYIMYDNYHAEFLIFGVTIICLFAITFIYTRIYFEVKKIQAKTRFMPNYTLHNNKAMITTLVIIGTFIICWLPNCIFQITMIAQIHLNKKMVYKLFDTFLLISKYLHILQLTNCIIDPIIYAVRLKIVKTGYRNFLKRLRDKYQRVKSQMCQKNKYKNGVRVSGQRHKFFTSDTPSAFRIYTQENGESEPLNSDLHNHSTNHYKLSDESDVNDNELMVNMVTFHRHFDSDNSSIRETTL